MLALLYVSQSKRILIAPLNWGLGHATRCIPLIDRYLAEGWEVTLASDGDARELLLAEYPLIECHVLPGYGITYPKNGSAMVTSMMSQIPRLTARINQEKKWLDSFLKLHPQDLILSDSRYGLHSSKVKSVILCHQLNIQSPKMAGLLRTIHARLLNRFDECWVPDTESRSYSGDLSRLALRIPMVFIGPITRLKKRESRLKKIPVLAILSGPEPQRSMLEEALIPVLRKLKGSMLIRGVMTDNTDEVQHGVHVKGHLLREEMEELVNAAELILCRSGYSSIMDLAALEKRAILIPTPGQTEQEYLADHVVSNALFDRLGQDAIESDLLAMLR